MMGFIEAMKTEGRAVESICRVLREQGYQIAARTYRSWRTHVVTKRTLTDAHVVDRIRHLAWTMDHHAGENWPPRGSTDAGRWSP